MVIQAIRFTFADGDDAFDEVLKPMLVKMLTTMLNDPCLENRRLALSALNSATHNKTDIILPHLPQLLPSVMKESQIRPELVQEVQMGPFKHKVDDGLEVRKVSSLIPCCRAQELRVPYRAPTRPFIPLWKAHIRASIPLSFSIA